MIHDNIQEAINHFRFEGRYVDGEEMNAGNINNSYHLIFQNQDGRRFQYTLQHINHYVFKNPRGVMNNISLVTEHLRRSLEREGEDVRRHVLVIVPTRQGDALYEDNQGGFWRAFEFVDQATAYDAVEKPEHFYEAGRAFGEFQRRLCDFPAERLYDTIPDFHNTPKRYQVFEQAVQADRVGRAAQVREEIEFFHARKPMMSGIVERLDSGEIPLRVTHNDTKINNVLIDDATDRAICVIDLDTVMPGSSLYDFGDAIRYGASTAAEDEADLNKIALDMDRFKDFTRGFLSETNGILSRKELELLPLGVKVITCELAMRFLTDYLDGDRYFKVNSDQHNLIRARAQMRLLMDVESKEEEMRRFIGALMD